MLVGKTNPVLSMLTSFKNTGPNVGFPGPQTEAGKTAPPTPLLPANVTRAVQHVSVAGKDGGFTDMSPKTAFEKISEEGFSQFTADLKVQKLKELREKILGAMGLNEESLAKLPSKQRAIIEKIVAEEIKRRLNGGDVMNGDAGQGKLVPSPDQGKLKLLDKSMGLGQLVNGDSGSKKGHAGMGMGPLLALQEINQKGPHLIFPDGTEKPGKKDLLDL